MTRLETLLAPRLRDLAKVDRKMSDGSRKKLLQSTNSTSVMFNMQSNNSTLTQVKFSDWILENSTFHSCMLLDFICILLTGRPQRRSIILRWSSFSLFLHLLVLEKNYEILCWKIIGPATFGINNNLFANGWIRATTFSGDGTNITLLNNNFLVSNFAAIQGRQTSLESCNCVISLSIF